VRLACVTSRSFSATGLITILPRSMAHGQLRMEIFYRDMRKKIPHPDASR
jgi:hypothetical protein